MKYNFDSHVSRRNINAVKWRYADENKVSDYQPLWIADMDFDAPSFIVKSLVKRANQPSYGYTYCPNEVYEQIIAWQKRRHNVSVKKGDVVNQGQIIGKSGACNLCGDSKYNLHIEIYKNGSLVNPEKYYDKTIKEISES